jgi:hypothetical protein
VSAGADDADCLPDRHGLSFMDEWVGEHVAVDGHDAVSVPDFHGPTFSAPRKLILVEPGSACRVTSF